MLFFLSIEAYVGYQHYPIEVRRCIFKNISRFMNENLNQHLDLVVFPQLINVSGILGFGRIGRIV